ncbi:MAG: right-handed parallel beta-helix repeat-containing protein, partial [Candidatus Sumerlaeota bacterium]|nr:right-handed parallel beta-helix repeat-containing protein [Candidatus Sumerlaeota bacterium]
GSFYAGRHAILHVRLERQPGRALSVNNGGNNHHNARTGPWIEGCLFENCGDDVCHVNGYTMSVATQPATDRLVINLGQPYDQYGVEARLDMRAGDRLLFYQRDKGRLLAEAKVVSSTLAPAKRALEVVTDRPIQGIVTGQIKSAKGANYAVSGNTEVTEVYNASRICNQFVFRHNIARNSRRVGVLAKGDGGLIEDNTFESLGGGGVEFWNAPFEGLAAENYVVRGNKILNCGRLKREHAAVWATIFKTGGDKLQRNLLISGNEIIGFPGPAIWLRDAQNAVVSNNSIAPAPPFAPGKSRVEPITLDNTSAVRLEKNIIKEPKP